MYMNIGAAIKTIRKQRGITQEELAEKCGISRTAISFIESGTNRPHEYNLEAICLALEITVGILHIIALDKEDMPLRNRKAFVLVFPAVKAMLMNIIQ